MGWIERNKKVKNKPVIVAVDEEDLLGVQKAEPSKFALAKVSFSAILLDLPVLVNFNITGITEDGLIIESVVNFREQSTITFSSRSLCDFVDQDQKFKARIVKSQLEKGSFLISAVFCGISEAATQKIREFTSHHVQES